MKFLRAAYVGKCFQVSKVLIFITFSDNLLLLWLFKLEIVTQNVERIES